MLNSLSGFDMHYLLSQVVTVIQVPAVLLNNWSESFRSVPRKDFVTGVFMETLRSFSEQFLILKSLGSTFVVKTCVSKNTMNVLLRGFPVLIKVRQRSFMDVL